MCYSTALRKKREEIERRLYQSLPDPATFELPSEYEPFFHLNGFTHGNLQIIKMDAPESIYPASWGLVPSWAMNDVQGFRKKSNTLNAKGETIFSRPSFRESASDGRCLIISDGFFEPNHQNGVSIPHFCYSPSEEHPEGDIFVFAGLFTELDDQTLTCSIITTAANEFFMEVHNKGKRMPLILDDNYIEDWLDDGMTESQINELIAVGFTKEEFKAHPVSRDLYKRGIDTNQPYIIEPVDTGTLF